MRRALEILARLASYVLVGALCFFVGTFFGPRAQLAELNLKSEETGYVSGHLAIFASEWSGREIAEAICGTQTELSDFHHTYALAGPGLHYLFSCSAPGKDTL